MFVVRGSKFEVQGGFYATKVGQRRSAHSSLIPRSQYIEPFCQTSRFAITHHVSHHIQPSLYANIDKGDSSPVYPLRVSCICHHTLLTSNFVRQFCSSFLLFEPRISNHAIRASRVFVRLTTSHRA